MKYCVKCGKEITDDAKFCNSCGFSVEAAESQIESDKESKEIDVELQEKTESVTAVAAQTDTVDITDKTTEPIKTKKQIKMTKTSWIIVAAVSVAVIIAIISIVNVIKINKYKSTIEEAYSSMTYGAQIAEEYATLESKVWYNCINEKSSTETDKYTKNDYGRYYSDFNDALVEFYAGETRNYNLVELSVDAMQRKMLELKDCPSKFEDEYKALKELYVAYSELTDLVVGDSSYSYNSFSDALDEAKSNYKKALSSARLILE